MAKNNDSLPTILILLGFVVFIIAKLVEFIGENIVPILTILGFGLGFFFIYHILEQRNKKITEKEHTSDYFMQEHIDKEQVVLAPHEKQIVNKQPDETIIDINNENFDLTIEKPIIPTVTSMKPPYWSHAYVYSYDDIKYATPEQKKYYTYLKEKVSTGEFIDIEGYTNYAFILYFDFLNEYQNHGDIKLLEEQFKLIGQICPKTKKYTFQILMDELSKRKDIYSIEKFRSLEDPLFRFENSYSEYNPYAYKLGSLYKDKLKLNKNEIDLLNKIWNNSNVFLSINDCLIEVMRMYCFILKEFEKKLEVDNIINKITEVINKELIRKKDYFESFESDIYLNIFKKTENAVRVVYGHNRKISDENLLKYSTRVQTNFNKLIGEFIDKLLIENEKNIKKPSKEAQIELNAQNVSRWKSDFNKLKDSFKKEDKYNFFDGIINLEETNKKNPNIENIFFEASKFIAKFDNVQSLKYYAKYIYYDLKSKKFDNKKLTKTVQKSLFKTDEQINDFKKIIAELIETSDIQKSLNEIAEIYIPKRKEIKLDKLIIKEVEQKHDGTVELLNEYLETEIKEPFKPNSENEETEISVVPANNSIFIPKISIGKIQEELITKIVSNSFEINQNEVANFATQNGLFKNQLIDSINEACEEYLEGEVLIEEDDENYVIEKSYYKEIVL